MKYRNLLILLSMIACVNPTAKGSKDMDELSTLYVTEPSGLLLRDAPSLAGNPLEQMPCNSQVRLLEPPKRDQPVSDRRSTWVRVQFKDQVGYAMIAYLGEHPAEHPADNRVFNQSRSAYYIVTVSDPGPNICGYGIDPRVDIGMFADGQLIHTVNGYCPDGWVDDQTIAYSMTMGECGYFEAQYFAYSIIKRMNTASQIMTISESPMCDSSGPNQILNEIPRGRLSICNFGNCTTASFSNREATIHESGQATITGRYKKDFEIDRSSSAQWIVLHLDNACWYRIRRNTGAVSRCE